MSKISFPKDFLFGVATASHQIEGNNHKNDWWEFEKAGKIKDGSTSDQGPQSLKFFEEDLKLLKKLNVNAYRFSISWSRVNPSKNTWSKEGFEYYHKVLESLNENGIEPFVTLHHITLPIWIARNGGWHNSSNIKWYCRYVEKVMEELGDKAKYWITINEPETIIFVGYLMGYFPPEKKNPFLAYKSLKNIILAHKRAYKIIHENSPKNKVTMVQIIPCIEPLDETIVNKKIARNFEAVFFKLFVDPVVEKCDYLGLDYYMRLNLGIERNVNREGKMGLPNLNLPSFIPFNLDMDYEKGCEYSGDWFQGAYPQGLSKIIQKLSKYNIPIIITENGISDKEDRYRKRFITDHLSEIHKMIKRGVDVKGYLYWTLVDNFEWREGFNEKFGLGYIKNENGVPKRYLKDSGKYYSKICKNRGFDFEKK